MKEQLLRSLGLKETTALVVGTIIGTGVFLKTAVMAQLVGSPFWVLLAWAAAGLLSLAGALTYAELGSLFPRAGGEYVYLKEGYNDLLGFLYGWMRFWIGSPGSIAAYAVGASTFLSVLLPLGFSKTFSAIFCIALFTLLNCFTVAFGGRLQTYMTYLKVFMIVSLIACVFANAEGASWQHLQGTALWPNASAFGACVLSALWAFDGWNNMPMAAGEVKNPSRVIPFALGAGLLFIFGLYLLANLAYFYALPFSEILNSNSSLYPDALPVATKAASATFGPIAVSLLSGAFVLSALGAMNGGVLTGARVPFAMACDKLCFDFFARVHPRTKVPVRALLVQGVWACVLAASGSFGQLTNYVVFSAWIFYALATGALFRLRKTRPDLERPFRVPFYPWLPALFLLSTVLLLLNTLWTAPKEAVIGLAFIALGIPAFWAFQKFQK